MELKTLWRVHITVTRADAPGAVALDYDVLESGIPSDWVTSEVRAALCEIETEAFRKVRELHQSIANAHLSAEPPVLG